MRDLREKVAQLIMPRLDGSRITDNDYFNQAVSLVDAGIGGFILFGGDMPDTLNAIERLQERAKVPLLITSDIERGLGQQITAGTSFPNQWAVAEAIDLGSPDDTALLHAMLDVIRDECISAGIHAVFAPVADVNSNPDNPIICTRSFGEDPKRVSWFVKEYVKGLQKVSVFTDPRPLTPGPFLLSCAKHFPGHGDTVVDSHLSLPAINASRKRLEEMELLPFKAAIDAGVGMIMVGHLQVPALEPEPVPATFSRKVVTNLLREEMGFKGLVVTDALNMGALKTLCSEGEAAVRALMAGCDILLHPSEPLKVLDAVVKAVEGGRLPLKRVDEAFDRMIKTKSLPKSHPPFNKVGQGGAIAYEIAKKAVNFRKGKAIDSTDMAACLVVDDDGDGSVAKPFLDAMKTRFPNFRAVSLPSDIKGDETAVLPVFSMVSAWKGSSGLSEGSFEKLKGAIDKAKREIVVLFGSPYILRRFYADTLIDAFDPADFMQRAAAEKLAAG